MSRVRTKVRRFPFELIVSFLVFLLLFGVVGAFYLYAPLKWIFCKIARKPFAWPEFLLEEDT